MQDKRVSVKKSVLRQMAIQQVFADALPVGVYSCDKTGALLAFNRRCVSYWGVEPQTGTGGEFSGGCRTYDLDNTPLPASDDPMAVALRTGKPADGRELIFERQDGSRIFVEVSAQPIFEQGELVGGVACIQDITKRKEAEVSLDNDGLQAARLAAIVASSDDAIVSKTLEGFITSWNAGAERIFGYSAEEIIGQHITRIVPPELRSEEEDILARLRRGEHIDHFETVRLAKDGRQIDVSVTVSPMRDKFGKLIGASKVGRDITERKHFESLQQLLISELNHRVKNTLATVQSIANQTVHHAKNANDFATSFGGRLQALARTHSLLTQSRWQGAELSDIIRDQLPLSETDRVSYSGPRVMLSAQAALHLSLVLHELETNAMKYGALSNLKGELSIRWMVRTDGGRHLVLRWQERGGPSVTAPQSRGFGTTLIEKSLGAHGGVTSISYEAEGITCEITLPLPESETATGGSYHRPLAAGAEVSKTRSYAEAKPVAGKHILVVDDEPLIAMDIVASLEDEGCRVVGPAATLQRALSLIERKEIDAALLDANLAGDSVDILAAKLVRRNIPFAFVSGYGREGLPEAHRQATLIKKPFQRRRVVDVVRQMLTGDDTVVPLRKKT
ncbi:MAG TPA: PAS domain S-box protein [Hyphomicrobium sp.]|nr:PAS domain S-box protein [Hyphomicrobium sp.]